MPNRRNRRAMTARVREDRILLIVILEGGIPTGRGDYFYYRWASRLPGTDPQRFTRPVR